MNQGKFYKSRRKRSAMKRPVAMLVSIALILVLSVGATVAFILDQTNSVKNTFQPAYVTPIIIETFTTDGTEKKDVSVTNNGNVSAYIRVALVPTWQDSENNIVGVSASLADLTIDGVDGNKWIPKNESGWVKGNDGYYYYTVPLTASDNKTGGTDQTNNLFTSAVVKTNNGYRMNLQILAQCIQAEGVASDGITKPVVDAWGIDPETLG